MADSFAAALAKFNVTAAKSVKDARVYIHEECVRSVVHGSELTGAPGQPVDVGNLRASWQSDAVGTTDPVWTLSTNVEYAPYIEDGENSRGLFTLRSKVGGFFSRALTIASFADRIVPFAVLKAGGGNTDRVFGGGE